MMDKEKCRKEVRSFMEMIFIVLETAFRIEFDQDVCDRQQQWTYGLLVDQQL